MTSKISRICWNQNNWTKPSGPLGKSKDKYSFECQNGFGHEEWLLDTAKVVKGYHYGYLQTVARHWSLYEGKRFDITLYATNCDNRESWWVGKIRNVEVIKRNSTNAIKLQYKTMGWYDEMHAQLNDVGIRLSLKKVERIVPCIRFRVEDLSLPDRPVRIPDLKKALGIYRYILLLSLA
jgi:hypothetical protein